jgi:hypothetical protein
MVSDGKALAQQHVTKARSIVARQRELIAEIRARGGDCEKMEDLLSLFERSLAISKMISLQSPRSRSSC